MSSYFKPGYRLRFSSEAITLSLQWKVRKRKTFPVFGKSEDESHLFIRKNYRMARLVQANVIINAAQITAIYNGGIEKSASETQHTLNFEADCLRQ